MTQTFQVNGMTCSGCENSVNYAASKISGVISAKAAKDTNTLSIETKRKLSAEDIRAVLPAKYSVENEVQVASEEQPKTWIQTYKPILLIFFYISVVTTIATILGDRSLHTWMRYFMAGFFLVFSFFKFLNLSGFASSYSMYDVVAKQWKSWAYVYAFVELALGIAFLLNIYPLLINSITLVVMSVSLIGVLQSVLNKRKIKCACLGVVFDLPMSTVTIIEDAVMITMSAWMIFTIAI
jgi:cation transport ATPase